MTSCVTRVFSTALLALALVFVASAGAQSPVTITDLGTLGGDYSYAHDVNDAGQVVGWSHLPGNAAVHAVLWSSDGTTYTATDLCVGSCAANSQAYGINDNGQVVGGFQTSPQISRGFRWENGSTTALSPLPGDSSSWAYDINNLGQIVGYSSGSSGTWAVLWDENGVPQNLGALGYPPGYGYGYSLAFGINEAGQVVGYSNTTSGSNHAFLWESGIGMTELGVPCSGTSIALGINESGDASGYACFFGFVDIHAAKWVNGAIQDLGTLTGSGSSWAGYINNAGDVSGYSFNGCGNHATLWRQGSLIDLGSLVSGPCSYSYGAGINNNGQIAGRSQAPGGYYHAVLFSTESPDADGDGVADAADNCPADPNANQSDVDGDGDGDACDADDDNDGVDDASDAFPFDAAESVDTDGDGTGNNADPDDDNDGVADAGDNCRLTRNADQRDTDGDGIGDACDAQIGPPTNKDQCKGGGWAFFTSPSFKNQGQCVSAVVSAKR